MNSQAIPDTYVESDLAREMAYAEKPYRDQIAEADSPLAFFHLGEEAVRASQLVEKKHADAIEAAEAQELQASLINSLRPLK